MVSNETKRVELLSPLKNSKSLNGIYKYADSVYFGIESLNMRSFSDNFRLNEVNSIVKRLHEYSIKAYLTTNVIIYDNEFTLVEKAFEKASEAEIDAVILHDLGAIELAKDFGLKFHISTQANVSNLKSARFYEKLGAQRIILARELSLDQVKAIKRGSNTVEIECFVHGAQCTSVSGRCYFSAEICGSQNYSANRGKCVQPCRRKWKVIDEANNELIYDGIFFINSKDLCMIEYIPQLIEAGIDAFKIEGRMRDPIYIEETTRCYKEAIDAYYNNTFSKERADNWLKRLSKVYNRGFSTGFYFDMPKGSEIERKNEGNLSKFKKLQIGKVISYFPEKKAAKILLSHDQIKLNEEIFIIGTHTDTYLRQKVSSIQIKQKRNLTETPFASKGKKIAVGILVDAPVKKNDKVYKFMSIS